MGEIVIQGTEEVKRMLKGLGEQAQKALVVTVNQTAYYTQQTLKTEVRQVFDRPNPRTQGSIRYQKASVSGGVSSARVYINDWPDGGIAPVKYLWPQVQGGQRSLKRSEVLLKDKGILPAGKVTRPGTHAPLDQYGNMQRGVIVQMLSQLQSFQEVGFKANAVTPATGKYRYFAKKGAGIFRRIKGATGAIETMMVFIKSPKYRKRYHFYEIGQNEADRLLPIEAAKSLDYALKNYR